jgi:hypothetical protein
MSYKKLEIWLTVFITYLVSRIQDHQ